MKHKPRSDDTLKQIAKDLAEGKIFCDRNCKSSDEIRMRFPLLAMIDKKTADWMKVNNVDFIFAYYTTRSPWNLNGGPVFLEFQVLTHEESIKMFEYYKQMKDIKDEAEDKIKKTLQLPDNDPDEAWKGKQKKYLTEKEKRKRKAKIQHRKKSKRKEKHRI